MMRLTIVAPEVFPLPPEKGVVVREWLRLGDAKVSADLSGEKLVDFCMARNR